MALVSVLPRKISPTAALRVGLRNPLNLSTLPCFEGMEDMSPVKSPTVIAVHDLTELIDCPAEQILLILLPSVTSGRSLSFCFFERLNIVSSLLLAADLFA